MSAVCDGEDNCEGSDLLFLKKGNRKSQNIDTRLPDTINMNSLIVNNNRILVSWMSIKGDSSGKFTNGIFKSEDFGKSWVASSRGLPSRIIIHKLLQFKDIVLIATNNGVYSAKVNSFEWKRTGTGLNGLDILAITVSDTYIFAGTSKNEIWRLQISEMP